MDLRVRPGGQPLLGAQNQSVSNNWSGYLLVGGTYASIQGTWIVPSVVYVPYPDAPTEEVTSTWIGIGGRKPDTTLIQLGTQQRVTPTGEVTYSAWYELLPDLEQPLGPDYPVSPGDAITASIQCTANCTPNALSTWVLTMNDGGHWSRPFQQQFTYRSSLASAEWTMEAVCLNNCVATPSDYSFLPNFSTVTFSGLSVNGANPNLSQQNAVVMNDANGGASSTPSAPVGGDSFNVAFGGPNAPPPPPPPTDGYIYNSFDVGGNYNTRVQGINDAGRCVGFIGSSGATSGFVINADGTVTSYKVVGATYTYLYGVNSSGTMVGYYVNAQAGYIYGFTAKDGSNAITTIAFPSARETFGYGINSRGQIVGRYHDNAGQTHGFLFDGANYITIDHPSATGGTSALGINDSGQIVGSYVSGIRQHGFLRNADGSFAPIEPPGAFHSTANGINNAGQVVGSYNANSGAGRGFLYSTGNYKTLDAPSSLATVASGINASGQIAGALDTASVGLSRTYGFIATPAGAAAARPASHFEAGPAVILAP
jgi:probable HAF family extracellular repeat protein